MSNHPKQRTQCFSLPSDINRIRELERKLCDATDYIQVAIALLTEIKEKLDPDELPF